METENGDDDFCPWVFLTGQVFGAFHLSGVRVHRHKTTVRSTHHVIMVLTANTYFGPLAQRIRIRHFPWHKIRSGFLQSRQQNGRRQEIIGNSFHTALVGRMPFKQRTILIGRTGKRCIELVVKRKHDHRQCNHDMKWQAGNADDVMSIQPETFQVLPPSHDEKVLEQRRQQHDQTRDDCQRIKN